MVFVKWESTRHFSEKRTDLYTYVHKRYVQIYIIISIAMLLLFLIQSILYKITKEQVCVEEILCWGNSQIMFGPVDI